MRLKRLATRPSRSALMIGTPPATLASKKKCPPPLRAALKISAPDSQISALLADTTILPAASAASVTSRASVVPPMSSHTMGMAGSVAMASGSVVSFSAGISTARALPGWRTATR